MTFVGIAGDDGTTLPLVEISVDFAHDATSSSFTWTDVTPYVRSWSFTRGQEHELGRFPAGEFEALLDNAAGDWDPDNASGAFYPNVKPMRRIRVRLKWAGVEYPAFFGVLQGYPLAFPNDGSDSVVQIRAYDLLSVLAMAPLETTLASATIGTGEAALTYTAKGAGARGNEISIEYHSMPYRATYHPRLYVFDDEPNRIVIVLATTDAAGTISSIATEIRDLVNGHAVSSELVTAELAAGNVHGEGVLSLAARTYLSGGTYAQELSSVRIQNVLDDIGVPSVLYAIETGYHTVAGAGFTKADKVSALSHIQDTSEAEDGRFYADAAGVLTAENKYHRINASSALTLGDAAGEVRYRDLVFTHDASEIWNTVRIEVVDGDVEEATSATSIAAYYPRTFERTVSLAGARKQLEAQDRAVHYVALYSEPLRRTPRLEVLPHVDTTKWDDVLARDISDRVTRVRRAPWGTISDDQHIEAIAMSAGEGGLFVDWQLSPADPDTYWVLADATYGVLGTTTTLGW